MNEKAKMTINHKGTIMDIDDIRGALARGYCEDGQTHKVMDPDLCEAQAQEIMRLFPQSVEAMPDNDRDPYFDFQCDIAAVINRHSIENRTDTPDFILAEYIVESLRAFEHLHNARKAWGEITETKIA